MEKKAGLSELFFTFAKIGLFTFGGGYAMISVIEHSCVEEKQWITHEDMMNVAVIAESTPGPIAINCATFVGCKQAGLPGAAAATIGVVMPSFVIIYLISMFLDNFLKLPLIASAFHGIQIGVGLLILNAGLTMWKKMKKTALSRWIVLAAAAVIFLSEITALKISSVWVMICAGLVSLSLFCLPRKGGGV